MGEGVIGGEDRGVVFDRERLLGERGDVGGCFYECGRCADSGCLGVTYSVVTLVSPT